MANTRLNPTSNGILHLGHIFMLLVNEYIAHSTGGKFYVRFDDENDLVNDYPKEKLESIVASQIEDINWMEVPVDGWSRQSECSKRIEKKSRELGYDLPPDPFQLDFVIPYVVRMGSDWTSFPYVPQQTVERVIMDNELGITHVIRGDDFLVEYCLYCYFCQKFDFPIPTFTFLPRLSSIRGDISKTAGGYKISQLRDEGYTPQQVKDLLVKACLIYPCNGWELYNIKSNPRLSI